MGLALLQEVRMALCMFGMPCRELRELQSKYLAVHFAHFLVSIIQSALAC
jgi:hypothetical protein